MTEKPILNLQDLSRLIGRSPETIRKDIRRNPAAVPPRLVIPGTRQLQWRVQDVASWLDSHVTAVIEGAHHV